MVGARHHRAAAGLFHRRRHRLGIGRHHRLADAGGFAPAAARARSSAGRAISASGLPGRRVEAMRAGMRMMASGIGFAGTAGLAKMSAACGAYTGCQKRGKPVSVRRRRAPGRRSRPAPHRGPFREPSFDEFLRAQQNPRRHPRHLPGRARAQYRAPAPSSPPEKPAKPGYAIAVKTEGGGADEGRRAEGSAAAGACSPRPRSTRASPPPSSARPATP